MAKEIIRIEGLSELKAALRELPDATAKNVIRRILKKRGEPIADHARRLAPVEHGELRDSIMVGTKLSRRQRSQHRKDGADDVEMFIGAGPHPQAHMQEFGTSKDPRQPFLRPAWDAGRYALFEGIKDDLWAEIEKAAARLARKAAKVGGK
jgi:HK97 gp10 family phage protein